MTCKISMIEGEPIYDSIPVSEILRFPLEKEDYKPYSQVRICLSDKYLYVQFLSFEAICSQQSKMECVINFYPKEYDKSIYICVQADKNFILGCCENGEITPINTSSQSHFYCGEDLQGIYWGADVKIPLDALTCIYSKNSISSDSLFMGNLYKTCKEKRWEHYGSFHTADFTSNYLKKENFGEFKIIQY